MHITLLILCCIQIVTTKMGLIQYDYKLYDEVTPSKSPIFILRTNDSSLQTVTTTSLAFTTTLQTTTIRYSNATSTLSLNETEFPPPPLNITPPYPDITYPTTATTNKINLTTLSTPTTAAVELEAINSTLKSNDTSPASLSESVIAIRKQIEAKREDTLNGYFTSSFLILLNMLMRKDSLNLQQLFNGLATQALRQHESLSVMGKISRRALQMMAVALATGNSSAYHNRTENTIQLLENKSLYFDINLNNVIDGLDAVYCMQVDLNDIAQVFDDIDHFPANKSEFAIADDALRVFIIDPLSLIQGSVLSTSLLKAMDDSVMIHLKPDEYFDPEALDQNLYGRRRREYHDMITKSLKPKPLPSSKKSSIYKRNFVYPKNKKWRDIIRSIREYKSILKKNNKSFKN